MKFNLKQYTPFLVMSYLHELYRLPYRNNNGKFTVGVLSGANFTESSLYLYWEIHKEDIKNWKNQNKDWISKLKAHYYLTMGETLETKGF